MPKNTDIYPVKPDCDASTQEFWYDLTDGGYLKPEEILVNPEDVAEVLAAIKVIEKFQASCEAQIDGFLQ